MEKSSLAKLVGVISATPFWAGLTLNDPTNEHGYGHQTSLIDSYAFVLIVFMAGTLWGGTFGQTRKMDILVSSVTGVALWIIFWTTPQFLHIAVVTSFVALLAYDFSRYYQARIPIWYWRLRAWLSTNALICLILVSTIH